MSARPCVLQLEAEALTANLTRQTPQRSAYNAMPQDSLNGAHRGLVGARDRLVKHGLLVDQLRRAGPSPALDLGLAQLRVFERDHIIAEAILVAVRARLKL